MTDSHNLSILANAGYTTFSNRQYNQLRDLLSDPLFPPIRACQNCGDMGDSEYDGEYVDTNVWWCIECIKSITPQERKEQFGE